MVLMPCSAADTDVGTELSAVLIAVSLSTPVIRKRTVGRMVMLPENRNHKNMGIIFMVNKHNSKNV